jgi:hypothetical protein
MKELVHHCRELQDHHWIPGFYLRSIDGIPIPFVPDPTLVFESEEKARDCNRRFAKYWIRTNCPKIALFERPR